MGDARNMNLAAVDRAMMQRALVLAARGAGFTAPNPMVGCVIAHGDRIVGEGWHRGRRWHSVDGLPHAEVEALRMAGRDARGATAYVTLEPCNHHGATPPCARALIEAGIARVVIAMADPNPLAANGGQTLRDAGICVDAGPCEDDARALNRGWLHQLRHGRPYLIAKYAASLDGRIATRTGDSQWITGAAARARGHELRQLADAIIVGAGTVIADNPALTARPRHDPPEQTIASHPLRVILDSTARTSPVARVFNAEGTSLLVTTPAAAPERLSAFADSGTEILTAPANASGRVDLAALMNALGARGVVTAMVEGGACVLGSFFDAGLIDEVWAFLAPMIIGGGPSPFMGEGATRLSDALALNEATLERLDGDLLIRGQVRSSVSGTVERVSCSQA